MRLFLLALLCIQAAWGVAFPVAVQGQSTSPPVNQVSISRYGFTDEDVGYLLFRLSDGRAVEAHRSDEPRIPASTTKVVTTVAALQILGADHRFNTTLLHTGEIRDGALSGDLYLRGGGDPTLSTDDLRDLVSALRQAGVKRITGNFFYDDSLLPTTREIEPKQPVAVSYNPGLSALSVNYNRIFLRWRRKPKSPTFTTSIFSPADGGPIPMKAITTGILPRGFDKRIAFLPDGAGAATDRWLLSPALPPRGTIDLPVRNNPGRVTALLFRTLCQQRDITLPLPQRGNVPAHARLLHAHSSAPLAEIITKVLRYSNNLAAELVGQATTSQLTNHPSSIPESASALTQWYRHTFSHIDWEGFHAMNHSGLSSATRHTPRQLAEILRHAWRTPLGGARFPDLLPPPRWGKDDERIRELVKAKSGTMSYADGLVGYLTTTQGQQFGFVILITDFDKRAALDATFDIRIMASSSAAQAWTSRAKTFEKALIARWIMQY
ncbi:MAG: D-alanyl-D-alanine carboxypeptidase/D-alanyl-D-alanine-endopeptidase [Candidatus Binatia bacterium]